MAASENRGPEYNTLNSKDPYYKDPQKYRVPLFSETPVYVDSGDLRQSFVGC